MRKAINDGVGNRAGTLALITDGDNATPKIVKGLFAKITNYKTARDSRLLGQGAERRPRPCEVSTGQPKN